MRGRRRLAWAVIPLLALGNSLVSAAGPGAADRRASPPGEYPRIFTRVAAVPGAASTLLSATTESREHLLQDFRGLVGRVFRSDNSGLTWRPLAALRLPARTTWSGDTSVAALDRTRFVATYLAWRPTRKGSTDGGLVATRSADGGRSWARPAMLAPNGRHDDGCRFPYEPVLAARGPHLAVAFITADFAPDCETHLGFGLHVATSHDGGVRWADHEIRRGYGSDGLLPAVDVGEDGTSYVVARNTCYAGRPTCSPALVGQLIFFRVSRAGVVSGPRAVGADFGVDRHGVLVDGRSGRLYAMASPFGPVLLNSEPTVYMSRDGGRSWKRRGRVLPAGIDARGPSMTLLPDGGIAIAGTSWVPSLGAVPLLATSRDAGASWSCPQLLSSLPFSAVPEITAMAVDGTRRLHVVWADQRDVVPYETPYLRALAAVSQRADDPRGCAALPVAVSQRLDIAAQPGRSSVSLPPPRLAGAVPPATAARARVAPRLGH